MRQHRLRYNARSDSHRRAGGLRHRGDVAFSGRDASKAVVQDALGRKRILCLPQRPGPGI